MKTQKKKFQFDSFDENLIQSLINDVYQTIGDAEEIFFDGVGQSAIAKQNDPIYAEEMQKIFDRVSPGVDFQQNSAELIACVKLKTCSLKDAHRLIGHYYNSTIYVPKEGISAREFAIEFKEKNNLKNFLRTARYKTLIEKDYHIEPENAVFVVKGNRMMEKVS